MQNKTIISKEFYYLYGKYPVISALRNPNRSVKAIWCTNNVFIKYESLIRSFPYTIVENDFLYKILGSNNHHQGIAAQVKSIFSYNIQNIDVKAAKYKIAILDQITDPQNIGAIIRSAAAFNINTIILPTDNSPNENATIAKTASGALELVQVIKVNNLRNCIEYLKSNGFWVIALSSKATDYFSKNIVSDKMVIVLGSEDKGIRPLVEKTCDYLIKIPISNSVESLNVSNAAAIIFHSIY